MKPEIYATKKAIAPITIAMVIMIRSRLSSGNMTQDGGISLEYTVACRAPSKGTPLTSPLVIGYPLMRIRLRGVSEGMGRVSFAAFCAELRAFWSDYDMVLHPRALQGEQDVPQSARYGKVCPLNVDSHIFTATAIWNHLPLCGTGIF